MNNEEIENRQSTEEYKVVSTKVSASAYRSLHQLAKKKGLSVYELMQMVADVLIRYMDDRHNLTPEMEQAMALFEHLEGWKNAFNLADPTTEPEVEEATYFLGDSGRHGMRAIHVEKPFFGMWSQTANVQTIMEKTICLLNSELYRKLRVLGVDLGTNNIYETLNHLIEEHTKDQYIAHMREEFEDANRSEWGKVPADSPYKKIPHRQMEIFDVTKSDPD